MPLRAPHHNLCCVILLSVCLCALLLLLLVVVVVVVVVFGGFYETRVVSKEIRLVSVPRTSYVSYDMTCLFVCLCAPHLSFLRLLRRLLTDEF
jgi:hypothetical protein